MTPKHFTIEEYRRTNKRIFVQVSFPDDREGKEIKIGRDNFERWLDNTDRLEWVCDTSDWSGEHQQKTGKAKPYEYWEKFSFDQISQDLYDYILIKNAGDVFGDIQAALEGILSDYND